MIGQQRHRADDIELSKLNLGCGEDYRHGDAWLNVDVNDAVHADVYHDLAETPWPWDDGQFQAVTARHVLEHLDTHVWDEIARVLAANGRFTFTYPIGHTRFEDATHQQYWNWNTAEWLAGDRKHGHESDAPFELIRRRYTYDISPWSWLRDARVRWRLWRHGPGPWLGQVEGLYGEVTAIYRREP